jgi:hypothetical protein
MIQDRFTTAVARVLHLNRILLMTIPVSEIVAAPAMLHCLHQQ